MGIINFLIVLFFNLWALIRAGKKNYLEAFTFKKSKWFSLLAWLYALWGIVNLIYVIWK